MFSKVLSIIFSSFLGLSVYGQYYTITGINIKLPPLPTDPWRISDVIARESITLKPGFSIAPAINYEGDETPKHFRIDESVITVSDNNSTIDLTTRTLDFSKAIGSIGGTFSVGALGEANYNIPIQLPIGTNGLVPQLTVNYSSNNRFGNLGYGFLLDGISAISVTGKNVFFDAKSEAIKLNGSDPLELDGNRLILITGEYGKPGSEYRTAIETYKKIVAFGNGDQIERFEVTTKEGNKMSYGVTDASILKFPNTSHIASWGLTRVEDPLGNYVQFDYEKFENFPILKRILYTGNSKIGLSPYNEVIFYYEKVKNPEYTYTNGFRQIKSPYIHKIETKVDQQLAGFYNFKYNLDEIFPRLIELGYTNSKGESLNPTIFQWDVTTGGGWSELSGLTQPYLATGDFNADGKTDVYTIRDDTDNDPYTSDDVYNFYFGEKKELGSKVKFRSVGTTNIGYQANAVVIANSQGAVATFVNVYKQTPKIILDFNGDGRSDIISMDSIRSIHVGNEEIDGDTYYYNFYLSYSYNTNLGFTLDRQLALDHEVYWRVGDFDGNGTDDLMMITSNGAAYEFRLCRYNLPDKTRSGTIYDVLFYNAADIDGDGISELLFTRTDNTQTLVGLKDGWLYVEHDNNGISLFTEMGRRTFGDFNRDAKTDFFGIKKDNSGWLLMLSDGHTFSRIDLPKDLFGTMPSSTDWESWLKLLSGDFNGDGRTDIVVAQRDNPQIKIGFVSGNTILTKDFIARPANLIDDGDFEELVAADFNGDGRSELLHYNTSEGKWRICNRNPGEVELKVNAISDGLNNTIRISYEAASFSNNVSYSTQSYSLPVKRKINFPIAVVTRVDYPTGTYQLYNYEDLLYHTQGKGLLGFVKQKFKEVNTNEGLNTTTQYTNSLFTLYSFLSPSNVQKFIGESNTPFFNQDIGIGITLLQPKGYRINSSTSSTKDNLSGILTSKNEFFDDNGNIKWSTEVTGDMEKTINYSNYIKAAGWMENKAQNIEVICKKTGQPSISTSTAFRYDLSTGLLKDKVDFLDTPDSLVTSYDYYPNGCLKQSIAKATIDGQIVERKSDSIEYDPNFRLPVKTTNALGFISSVEYDFKLGLPTKTTDINGLVSTTRYDNWGRKLQSVSPIGIKTDYSYQWCQSGCPNGSLYKATIRQEKGMPSNVYYDRFGQVLTTESIDFARNVVKVDKKYNSRGKLIELTNLYTTSANKVTTVYGFDEYGRSAGITPGNLGSLSYSYAGLTTTASSPLITTQTTKNNSNLVQSTNDGIANVEYTTYNAAGQPLTITTPGKTITLEYHPVTGKQTKLIDPDAGTLEYRYNPFGELVYQKDSVGHEIYDFKYDALGRLTQKKIKNALTNLVDTCKYIFDTAPFGKGKLAKAEINNHSNEYVYDLYSRVVEDKETINGTVYTTKYEYDEFGRMYKHTYPSGFATINVYNDESRLTQILRADNNTKLWELKATDPSGMVSEYDLGNGATTVNYFDSYGFLDSVKTTKGNSILSGWGYVWDKPTGQLSARSNLKNKLSESFEYHQDRLTNCRNSAGDITVGVVYDPGGKSRISTKTDVGTYGYDETTPGANAVKNITDYQPPVSMESQVIDYNAFNKANHVEEAGYELTIDYGHHQQRIGSKLYHNNLIKEKIFVGDYEVELTNNGTIKRELHYIQSPAGLIGIFVKQTGQPDKMYYTHQDHLGSITEISDQNGTVVEEMSFDAWGRRRNPTDWSYLNTTNQTWSGLFDRGYTGHEHLDAFGLINMNGRMYDPALGLMLSPDKYINNPASSLSYNRFLYANGNPLKYTDPTGNTPDPYVYNYSYSYNYSYQTSGTFNYVPYSVNYQYSYLSSVSTSTYQYTDGIYNYTNYRTTSVELTYQSVGGSYGENSFSASTQSGYTHTSDISVINGLNYGFISSLNKMGDLTNFITESMNQFMNQSKKEQATGWVAPANTWNGGFGVLAGAVENFSGNTKVLSQFTAWLPGQGMHINLSALGKVAGTGTFIIGSGLDAIGVYNYYFNGANDPNAVHPGKAVSNLGIGAWGFLNPATAFGAAVYYSIDTFYPGGFSGAMDNNSYFLQQNQEILGPAWNLYR